MFCPKCGAELPENATECPSCHSPVTVKPKAAETIPQGEPASVPQGETAENQGPAAGEAGSVGENLKKDIQDFGKDLAGFSGANLQQEIKSGKVNIFVIIAAVVGIISLFIPFVNVAGLVSMNGFSLSAATSIFALLAAVLVILFALLKKRQLTIIASAVYLVLAVIFLLRIVFAMGDVSEIGSYVSAWIDMDSLVSYSAGMFIMLIAGIAMLVLSIIPIGKKK